MNQAFVATFAFLAVAGCGGADTGQSAAEQSATPAVSTPTVTITEQVTVDPLDGERDQLNARKQRLDERDARQRERKQALDARERELDRREKAVGIAEKEAEANQFSDGVWLVGQDIKPGTYRTQNETGMCYWARLSGTSGDFDDLIANGNPDGPTVVTIAASDVAFESSGCGQWDKVG